MKIQDIIHLYHGCKIVFDNKVWELFRIETTNKGIIVTGRRKEQFLKHNSMWATECKPILRRLEDISDDEWFKIECETSVAPDAIGWHGVRESIMTMENQHRFHWTITNEVLIILRKLSVDVDGLIDAGLAIDAKTITNAE